MQWIINVELNFSAQKTARLMFYVWRTNADAK